MNKDILAAWDKHQEKVREWIATVNPRDFDYKALLENTIRILFTEVDEDDYDSVRLDFERITEINHGDYQGTLVYVIGEEGYQPGAGNHWYTCVEYGSCSGCDVLESLRSDDEEEDSSKKEIVQGYWTLCLHMIQKMKRMYEDDDE